jgi:hypothetical protein
MSINFQEILKELEYRVEHGIIDLTKEEQVTKLAEILEENGIPDANQMAQKVRVYFSYLNEASILEKGKNPAKAIKPVGSRGGSAARPAKSAMKAATQGRAKTPQTGAAAKANSLAKDAQSKGVIHLGRGYYGKSKGSPATFKKDDSGTRLVKIQPGDGPQSKMGAEPAQKGGKEQPSAGGKKAAGGAQKQAPTTNITPGEFRNDAEKRAASNKAQAQQQPAGIQFKTTEQREVWQGLNDGDINVLVDVQDNLTKQRDRGIAGAGGSVPSYGENQLCNFANQLIDNNGYDGYIAKNARELERYKNEFLKPAKNKVEQKQKDKIIEDTAQALGLERATDFKEIVSYIAARNLYGDQELKRLQSDKKSVWYLGGKNGFGKNREALKDWTDAEFDGAISTNILIKTNSAIDTTQPYIVMQSNPKEDGHDKGILQHLKTQAKYAKGADKKHYEHEIDSFEHLGFHDTYAVGFDKNGRTTVFSISNKKANHLEDIWNNTTPAYMLGLIKDSFGPKVSNKVINILQKGVVEATDSKKGTNLAFSEAKIDDAFVGICELPEMEKYMDAMQANKAFNKWLDENDIAPEDTADWLKAGQDYTRQAGGDVAYDSFGKIFTKIGEISQIDKFRKANPEINYNSLSIQSAVSNKNKEKNVLEAIHNDVAGSIAKADKELGFPKKNGKNGPHTQAYLTTIMKSMHFDLMVTNYDKNLGVITGIRGTTSADFRNALAIVSKFKGEVKTEAGRAALNKHLVENCKLDPQTRAIVIKDGDKSYSIVEDTWRTAGTSQKVEKKIGDQMRHVLIRQADNRRKKEHY